MRPQPNRLLLAATLAVFSALAFWMVRREDTPPRASSERHIRSNRERPAGGQKTSRSTIGKPVRVLSNDDLAAIYHRDGAAAALAAAKSQPWSNRDNAVYFILNQLAVENPELAAAELKSSGLSKFLKSGLVDTILKNWKDGRKALDWAENQLTGELHCKAVAGALGILVKSEHEAAFGYFEKLPPGETRRLTIRDLFAVWGSHDPETALLRANELAPDDLPTATEHVLRGWAKSDPAAAAAWVLKTSPTNEKWMAGVYQSWISVSPGGAKAWSDSLPEGDAKKIAHFLRISSSSIATYTMGVLTPHIKTLDDTWATKPFSERDPTDLMHWAIQDTAGARTFVEQNGTNPALKQLAPQVAAAISGKIGPSEAMDWALSLPEEIRKFARGEVLNGWCDRDPAAAAGKLESLTPEQCGEMPIYLARNWVSQHPAAAADWVAGWKGDYQPHMIEGVFDRWQKEDPQAAFQWLGTLPAGIGRDYGIRAMIRAERDSAPAALQPWIDLISDPQLREKTRRELK